MSRDIVFWDSEDEERLTYSEQDDAIECLLDGTDPLPEKLEICGYARMELPKAESLVSHVLDHLMETLDKEYADPEGSYTDATDGMKEAAKVFVAAVLDEYTNWACELVKRETIDVMEWVKANRPDWLKE